MRYAIVFKDGSIGNIAEVDSTSESGKSYIAILENSGYSLVPLKDIASDMGGINVEPGDICSDVAKQAYTKGTLGSKPITVIPVIALANAIDEKV